MTVDPSAAKRNDGDPDIEIHSNSQNELRELVSVVRLFNSAAADRIVEQRQDLAAALARFRKARTPAEPLAIETAKRDDEDDLFSPPFGIGMADNMDSFQKKIGEYGAALKQAQRVGDLLKKDPAEAVRLARGLPDLIRAEALAAIASSVTATDLALASSVVDACVAEIGRVQNPASRIPALVKLGGIYSKLKDPTRAYAAYERALADAVRLWSQDTKPDRPNVASRDTWPSTQESGPLRMRRR